MRRYVIYYYLADDTVEVQEIHEKNDGRDPFPLLLKKMKLPRDWKDKPINFPSLAMESSDEEVLYYYTPKDFLVGETIFILGRRFLIYDTDKFTRKYFEEILKITQKARIDVFEKKPPPPVLPIPPHLGFGSPEDSLQSCLTVTIPVPPKKDVVRYVYNINKYLRYEAIMDWVHPEDKNRKFVFSYCLSDCSITINEIPQRNSGFMEGTYLRATRVPKPGTNLDDPDYYTPVDLYIGDVRLRLGFSSERIVGGTNANKGDFPYQISLQQVILGIIRSHICGGSIISPTWVLTAAHCIPSFGTLEVVAGEHNLNTNEGTEQRVAVQQSIVHAGYGGSVGPNDIAVVRLRSALTYNEYVQPIALPAADEVFGRTSILSGWGSTSTTSTASMPAILQTAQLPIVEYNQCLATYGSDSPLDPTNVCTGPLSGGMGACSGDSGGPLVQVKSDGSREIIGIVSWGVIPCGSSNAPSVYVRVSAFIDWINNNIQ
ncbi:hypothetical protein L9F63_017999 [Diploptera punctata]|uniref:Uncharacterized protein n=1 Tax=Diploptera punctata TaxID=6984 RepID=A0AAD7ZYS9_DIPPU|nr:hypothetical protein L9F63_017999 [Diploptera punctata]